MKKKEQKLINDNSITRKRNAIAISRDQLLWRASFSLNQTCLQFLIKINDVTIFELPKKGVKLNHTFSNRYKGADLMFLFKESLSLIIRRLSFNFNTNFLFYLLSILKFSKNCERFQSKK